MPSKKPERQMRDNTLPFDTTQEIDPAFADLLRPGAEPTLTQREFEDLELERPPPHPPRR